MAKKKFECINTSGETVAHVLAEDESEAAYKAINELNIFDLAAVHAIDG